MTKSSYIDKREIRLRFRDIFIKSFFYIRYFERLDFSSYT